MKIGVHVSIFTSPGGPQRLAQDLTQVAQAAEDNDFDKLSVMDHLWQIALPGAESLARQAADLGRVEATRAKAADALAAVLAAQGRWAEALAVDEATVAESGETAERLHRMLAAALEAGYADRARVTLARPREDLPLTRVLASWVALVGVDAATALAEADRVLDFLGDRAAAAQARAAQAKLAAAAGRTQAELRAAFQLGKQDFFDGHGLDQLRGRAGLAGRSPARAGLG